MDDDDDDDEEEEKAALYEDFFGNRQAGGPPGRDEDADVDVEDAKVDSEADSEDAVADSQFEEAPPSSSPVRAAQQDLESQHERAAAKMAALVRRLEGENLGGLGGMRWDLSGEVTAKQRAMNSALAADLDFESSRR